MAWYVRRSIRILRLLQSRSYSNGRFLSNSRKIMTASAVCFYDRISNQRIPGRTLTAQAYICLKAWKQQGKYILQNKCASTPFRTVFTRSSEFSLPFCHKTNRRGRYVWYGYGTTGSGPLELNRTVKLELVIQRIRPTGERPGPTATIHEKYTKVRTINDS